MMKNHVWQVLSDRVLLAREPWLVVREETVRLPDGRVVEGFLKIDAPAYVAVFGVREDGRVVAVQEYKHGPGRVALQPPAGFLEPNENPLVAAQRELLEETGYAAREWRLMGRFHTDGNRGMSLGHYFFATGLHQVAEPNANDLGQVTPVLLTPDELHERVMQGAVLTAGAAACFLLGLSVFARQ
ncbi:MAG: NUDIX hydrolase [Chloroflexi bacterium]|nr:NUDIX hydrolase [Chloroflexota bacterium]